jgi:hypothetical protein
MKNLINFSHMNGLTPQSHSKDDLGAKIKVAFKIYNLNSLRSQLADAADKTKINFNPQTTKAD